MVSQLRIYTINRGMMDSWVKLFEEQIRPIHDSIGVPVVASWVNADRTEFIWVRRFNSADEIADKEAEYFASPGTEGPRRRSNEPYRQDGSAGDRGGGRSRYCVEANRKEMTDGLGRLG